MKSLPTIGLFMPSVIELIIIGVVVAFIAGLIIFLVSRKRTPQDPT